LHSVRLTTYLYITHLKPEKDRENGKGRRNSDRQFILMGGGVLKTESKSKLRYDWRFNANQFVLETSPFRLTTSNFIFQLNTCGYNPYVTSSLTRGWVCRLQLLLVLASAVILRSEFRGTHDYCLRFETPPTGGPGPRIYIQQEEENTNTD
jgi:hypothetical protein